MALHSDLQFVCFLQKDVSDLTVNYRRDPPELGRARRFPDKYANPNRENVALQISQGSDSPPWLHVGITWETSPGALSSVGC